MAFRGALGSHPAAARAVVELEAPGAAEGLGGKRAGRTEGSSFAGAFHGFLPPTSQGMRSPSRLRTAALLPAALFISDGLVPRCCAPLTPHPARGSVFVPHPLRSSTSQFLLFSCLSSLVERRPSEITPGGGCCGAGDRGAVTTPGSHTGLEVEPAVGDQGTARCPLPSPAAFLPHCRPSAGEFWLTYLPGQPVLSGMLIVGCRDTPPPPPRSRPPSVGVRYFV